MARYVGTLEQGGEAIRFTLFDGAGGLVADSWRELERLSAGVVPPELDALAIWVKARTVIRSSLVKAGVGAAGIALAGVAAELDAIVVWDRRTGTPIHNALVTGGDAREIAGAIRRILETAPHAREQADAGNLLCGRIDSWLLWNLTGGTSGSCGCSGEANRAGEGIHVTDGAHGWDPATLEATGIARAMLPALGSPTSLLGEGCGDLAGVPVGFRSAIGDLRANWSSDRG